MNIAPHPSVVRALELSRQVMDAAQRGELAVVVDLDAQRASLLRQYLDGCSRIGPAEAPLLEDIAQLNEKCLAMIDEQRRETADRLDLARRGRRAVDAYSVVQAQSRQD